MPTLAIDIGEEEERANHGQVHGLVRARSRVIGPRDLAPLNRADATSVHATRLRLDSTRLNSTAHDTI